MRRRPRRLHLVIAASDGGQAMRVTIARWVLQALVASVVVAAAGLAVLIADYRALRMAYADNAELLGRLDGQQETIGRLRANLESIHGDVTTWPALHAKIVAPFGRVAPAVDPMPPAPRDPEQVADAVHRATGTLRQIAAVATRLDGALARLPSEWPVRAALNSGFGPRRSPWSGDVEFHRGVDIASGAGAPVRAPAAGAVSFSGTHGGYGLAVIMEHGAGVQTLYGHLSRVSVEKGDRIERGHVLGRSGNTGRSTGAHLHYEVVVAGRQVDPRTYMWD